MEAMAAGREILPQLAIVVDLAVVYEPSAPPGIGPRVNATTPASYTHRLVSGGGEVDDRESAMRKADAAPLAFEKEHVGVVEPSVGEPRRHRAQKGDVG